MFGHPVAIAKRGLTSVPGSCVDFVQNDQGLHTPLAFINVYRYQHDGDGLGKQSQAHDLIGVFLVELTASTETTNTDRQNNDDGDTRDYD